MVDVIVVGAGIIGATCAKVLREYGREVLLLDDGRPKGGSRASGGHLKPSWFGKVPEEIWKPSMALLDATWGLKEEEFEIRPSGLRETVYRVDTDEVMGCPKTLAKVTSVRHLHNYPIVSYEEAGETKEERCKLLLIAAGAWAEEILDGFKLDVTGKQGVSFRVKGSLTAPFIQPWAPYKQVVAHQQGNNDVWIGDGTAVLERNWTEERTLACKDRCLSFLPGPAEVAETREGIRPYCKHAPEEPCLLVDLGPRAWLATGAGKSGTLAAGWVGCVLTGVLKK